ncbi:MAG: EamA family transporter [bacterium]|nr:EamA family transporter [bacterium]
MENNHSPSRLYPGYFKIIFAVLIWSSWGIIIHRLKLPPALISFSANMFGWIFLAFLGFGLGKGEEIRSGFREIKTIGLFLLLGVFVSLNNVLYFQAFLYTTVANSVFSHYLAPVLIFILGPLILREKLEGRAFFSLSLSVLGLYLVINGPGLKITAHDLTGISLGLGSALFYALVVIMFRKLSHRYSPLSLNLFANLASSLLLLPLVAGQIHLIFEPGKIIALIIIGIILSGFIPMLYISGLKEVPAHHAGILSYMEPIGGILLAFFLLSEPIGKNTVFGAALILGAGYYLIRPKK